MKLDPSRAIAVGTALRALEQRAGDLARVEAGTLFGGVVDRAPALDAIMRASSAADQAVVALRDANVTGAALGDAKLAVRMLEHAAPEQVALQDLSRRLGDVTTRIRSSEDVARLLDSADAGKLLERPAGSLTADEWARLGAIVELGGDAVRLPPAQLEGLPAFRELLEPATAGTTRAAAAQRYFDAWQVEGIAPDVQRARIDELLRQPSSVLADAQWGELARLLEHGTDDVRALSVPKVAGGMQLRDIARSIVDGTGDAAVARRAFDDEQFLRMGGGERIDAASSLLHRPASELSTDEWQRLSQLLDDDRTFRALRLPEELTDVKPIRQIAREVARGDYRPTAKTQRYFEHFRLEQMDDAQRRADAASLFARDAADLSSAEWSRLAAMLDHVPTRRVIALPDELTDVKPLRQIAREVANGDYRPTEKTQRYFELFRVQHMDDAERLAQASELFARDADTLATSDWRRLAALLEHAPTRAALKLPAELPDTKPLGQIAREVANGEYRPSVKTQRYFELYRLNQLDDAQRLDVARSLFQRDASELSSSEWNRLALLLDDAAVRRAIDLPDELPATKPLVQIAREVAAGEYRPTAKTQAYFELFRLGQLDDAQRMTKVRELFARDAAELSSAEWTRLVSYLDHAPTRRLIDLPDELSNTKPLRQIAVEVANGEYRPTAKTQRYFELFRLNAMPEAERLAEVARLFSRDAADLSSSEWTRLSTLLEHPATSARINVPAELPETKPLRQIAVEVANGEYRPTEKTQAYFTEWRRRNDPAYQQRLERALDDVTGGHADDEARRLVAGEWSRLEQIVEGRPPAEQAAIAAVMMELDSVAGSRSVRSTLELLRSNLKADRSVPAELESVRAQTLELLERNIARLEGSTPTGAVRGYSNHPDYGEVGRIRANVSLIRDVQAQARIADVAPTADAVGAPASAETLTW